jgi:hypothetical protein
MGTSIVRRVQNYPLVKTAICGSQAARWLGWLRILIVVVLFCPSLEAQSINAPAALTLFHRESLVRLFAKIDRFSQDVDGGSVHGTQYITPLALVYGFYPKWMVVAAQPYVTADVTTQKGAQVQHMTINGFADTQFFLQYDGLYSKNTPGGLTRLSGVFGLQAPTGAERFSTGAFQYTGGLIFEKAIGLRYYFTSDFEYTFATRNGQGVSTGDSSQFDAVPAYLLIPRQETTNGTGRFRRAYDRIFRNGTFLILEFNGAWHASSTLHGSSMPNTGGTTLQISPGIQYFLSRRFLLEFSAPLPAVTELKGIQPNPRGCPGNS